MDAFGFALSVVDIANKIRASYLDVKGFPGRCKRLSHRIDSLLPAVQLLDKSDVSIIQEKDVPLKTYATALKELHQCVDGIYRLINDLKDETFMKRFMRQDKIKGQFDDYSERLDVLQQTLQFCLMVEMRVLFDKAAVYKKQKKEEFKNSKEAFRNRQEVDLEDQKTDEQLLVEYLPKLIEGQKETQEQLKELSEQLKDLKVSISKPATNPVGFDVEEVKKIQSSELSHYEKIGEGSLGVVYKAMYGKEIVAVKKISPDKKANLTDMEKNLIDEATNLKRFDSSHVVRLWGIITEPGSDTMIVYEYMNKGTLRSFLRGCKDKSLDLPWERRIRMANGGALGLYRIHNLQPKMLHCDIGSDKFLVNSNFDLKMCDVGFAKTKTSAGRTKNRKKVRELGTMYFAPEHLLTNIQKYDERSEMYGYGLVMWEIATCETPFKGKNASDHADFLEAKKMEPLPDDCPRDFARIIDKCRSFDRMLRPLAGELVDELATELR